MSLKCEHFEMCGFLKKYKSLNEIGCRGYIRMYCEGIKLEHCRRKQHFSLHGGPPPDDMLPNGKMLI